jgi:hypothetical protein
VPRIPEWWEDHDELVAYANWYFAPVGHASAKEVLYFFEKPWKETDNYKAWKSEDNG